MLAVYFVSGWMPPTVIIALVAGLAGGAILQMTEHLDRIERRLWEGANDQALGVPLIVTYHPAYLLRNLEDKARAWDDLCLAAQTAESVAAAAAD